MHRRDGPLHNRKFVPHYVVSAAVEGIIARIHNVKIVAIKILNIYLRFRLPPKVYPHKVSRENAPVHRHTYARNQ